MPRSRANLEFDGWRGQKARLQPPYDLGSLERGIFISVVNSVPAAHFAAEDIDLLRAYVCSLAQQRRAAEEIAAGSKDPFFVTMHAAAVRSIRMLSARLRLGPQSRNRNCNQRRQATTRMSVSAYDPLGLEASPPTFKGFRE
jgi:hypothetical protein